MLVAVTYMPYLTLWDKISQNLAHLEANSHKIFKIFRQSYKHILWRNKHKSHYVVFITSSLHLNKSFWLLWRSSKVIFYKNLTEFYQISLKNLTHLTDFNPQLMACVLFRGIRLMGIKVNSSVNTITGFQKKHCEPYLTFLQNFSLPMGWRVLI